MLQLIHIGTVWLLIDSYSKDAMYTPFSLYWLSLFEVLGPSSSSSLASTATSFSSVCSRLLLCLLKVGELTSA